MGCPYERVSDTSTERLGENEEESVEHGPINYWDLPLQVMEEFENENWQSTFDSTMSQVPDILENQEKGGSLIMVGTGTQSVGHITIATKGQIENADCVFYRVADPVTKLFIKHVRPDAKDLDVFLRDDKETIETRLQIAEVLLNKARKGFAVVGVFYGNPAHHKAVQRSIDIAKLEGIHTLTLPAPSIADGLMTDLDIQVGGFGILCYDSSEFLKNRKQIQPDCHFIITSIDETIEELKTVLHTTYDEDEFVTVYESGLYPHCKAVTQTLKVKKFQNVKINSGKLSAVYIAPNTEIKHTDGPCFRHKSKSNKTRCEDCQWAKKYNSETKDILKNAENWTIPEKYKYALKSELSVSITRLAKEPQIYSKFFNEFLEALEGELCKDILLSANSHITSFFLEHNISHAASKSVVALMFSSRLRTAYLRHIIALDSTKASSCLFFMDAWLQKEALHSTPIDIQRKWNDMRKCEIWIWAGTYEFKDDMELRIIGSPFHSGSDEVWFGTTQIANYSFSDSVLSWSVEDGNAENAQLTLHVDNLPLFQQSEDVQSAVIITGYLWKSQDRPAQLNAEGSFERGDASDSGIPAIIPVTMLMDIQEVWQEAKQCYMTYLEAKIKDDREEEMWTYDKYTEVRNKLDNEINCLDMIEMQIKKLKKT